MSQDNPKSYIPGQGKVNLPIVGGLILFSVILGTTNIGYIPVPTAAKHATTMHLPTIIASLLEGWPIGMIVGAVFGITSMYMGGSPMVQDPLVALVPRMLVGLTPFLVYMWLYDRNEYVRLGLAAVAGTLTNTFLVLGIAVFRGYMELDKALNVALIHGLPEVMVAVLIVIPAVFFLRRLRVVIDKIGR
ncbi:MAG: ECF transporter S component [Pseudodesulfovibrio sp.]